MATIGTRIKDGQEEIIVYNINDDLNSLIDAINEIREEDPFGIKNIHYGRFSSYRRKH